MKKAKEYLIPAIITATTTLVVLVVFQPFGEIFEAFLQFLERQIDIRLSLRITVSLLIVILSLNSYVIYLRKKYHYKKRFRFGVYWKDHTPFCPHCGGKLVETGFSYLQCLACEERLRMPFGGQTHIKLEQAIDELKKDGQ
ncbi:MAG: hypothetical protein JEY94_06530 [Melioribacteraceae bacterium]|nr:hypothetical protein [Melioribacteraceae bacterium]